MTETDVLAPKIEFPCARYPIKIIGEASEGFTDMALEIIQRHAPDFDRSSTTIRSSKTARYFSVQVLITATGIEQLEAIHNDLRATGRVSMVL